MGNLGFTEIMIILLVVLLVFGAKRLPEIGASMGKGIRKETEDAVLGADDRNAPNRSLDAGQREAPTTTGEPKRLSQ